MNHLVPPEQIAPGHGRGPGERILIVDDEPRMRLSMRQLLARPGLEISEAGTVAAARQALKAKAADLVLLDIGLPDVSGLDMLRWIARHQPGTEVIIVSGDARIDSAIRAMRR